MDQFNAVSQAPSADMYSILMQRPDETAASETYRVPIGTQSDGTMLSADLEQITHMLVCGYSGTGKTSFVQTAALYLARNHSPKHIHFILFDSKMVDYASFRNLPHLARPIINDDAKSDETLSWLEKESARRLALIHNIGAKDIVSYNQQCSLHRQEPLPRIILILDDFASLQMYKKYKTPMALISVLQNGRIAGIHVVLVTSVTSSKILPQNLLSLIPCRVAFDVAERADSRLVIDKEGAESLRVPGELMVSFQSTLKKCEGVYLPETQMPSVMKRIKRDYLLQLNTLGDMAETLFSDLLKTEQKKEPTELSESQLLNQATEICVEFGQLSATVLQRRLRIGYAKAARIIDLLEENGIVGPSEGVKPRKVLISQAQWESAEHDLTNLKKEIASKASSFLDKKSSKSSGSSPEINLRDFNELTLDGLKLSIRDNCIRISKKVMTKLGPGTTTMAIEGRGVAGLVFRKPSLFSKGYMQIKLKPNIALSNNTPDIFPVTKDDLSYLLTIEFPSNASESVKAFMTQISEATSLPLEKADAKIKNILGSLKKTVNEEKTTSPIISSEQPIQRSQASISIPWDSSVFVYEPTKKDAANHNTAFFEHGVLVNVSPRNTAVSLDEDRDVAYQARYIVSDGVKYDLCNPKDVYDFIIPVFDVKTDGMFINVTRDLSYIMKIIAQQVYQKGLAIPMVFTTVNLMLASPVGWRDIDYDRMISQLERLEEYQYAKDLREGIMRVKPDIFDADLRDAAIMNFHLQMAALTHSDLLEMPYLGCACAECAKYQGRVYSISGKDKRFPKLHDFLIQTGKVHPGCRHNLVSYNIERPISKYVRDESGEVIELKLDAVQNSNRPFIDDRTPDEKRKYEEVLARDAKKQNAVWDEESTRKYTKRRIEYEWIVEHLSDLAPKSLNAYTRMKRIRSEKYLQIKTAAEKLGMVLDDDL